jgi:hypothetical protein
MVEVEPIVLYERGVVAQAGRQFLPAVMHSLDKES